MGSFYGPPLRHPGVGRARGGLPDNRRFARTATPHCTPQHRAMTASPTPATPPLTYEQAGVNYDLIDPLKVAAQRAAASTAVHLAGRGFTEVAASRGGAAPRRD